MRNCRTNCAECTVLDLERHSQTITRTGTEQALGSTLRKPAVGRPDEHHIGCGRPAQHLRLGAHRRDHPPAAVERRQARKRVGATIERQRERRDAAAVDCDRHVAHGHLGGGRDLGAQVLLERMVCRTVGLTFVAVRATDREKGGVLPGAGVSDGRTNARLEVRFGRGGTAEEAADGGELFRSSEVGGARDRDLPIVEVVECPHEGESLERLGRGAQEGQDARIAGFRDDLPVANRNRVHGVNSFDDLASGHLDLDRTRHSGETTPMPELPEVEAWVRELDPLVARSPVDRAGPAHIATLKTFDPPLSTLADRRLSGARRRGKNLLFPTADGELVLRVHLMSAGRLRYHAPGTKTPKSPMFRLAFADGAELVLTEGGKKKRAGVWLVTPETLEAELAHLGPDALGLGADRLGEILARERRQLHPLLRDQRVLAGIGRAHANEILWLARLSPFKISADLPPVEVARLAAAMDEDLRRALSLREAGKGDADVYRIHGHFGEPCPLGHDTLRRVDFEEHTITYCPTCQTGGKELKDRRLSRLLR